MGGPRAHPRVDAVDHERQGAGRRPSHVALDAVHLPVQPTVEFSWLALNMTPLKNQKIHWRSVPGTVGGSLGSGLEVANSGQIRFARKGEGRCTVKLTISYEVPSVLAPFASLLRPVVEGILQTDMRRFAEYAVQQQQGRSATA